MKSSSLYASFLLVACSDKGVTVFNPSPQAEITSHFDGDTAFEGLVTTLEGNVSDPNHTADELTVSWKSTERTLCTERLPEEDGAIICEVMLTFDDSEIILEVRDSDNARGEDRVYLEVVPSQNPVAEILSPTPSGIYYADHLVTFEGVVSDPEDAPADLNVKWESNRDGILSGVDGTPNSIGNVQGYGYLSEGEHAIELHVEDTTGYPGVDTVVVQVGPPNSAPSCEITEPINGSGSGVGEEVRFLGWANDVDVPANMLLGTWYSDKDGELGNSTVNYDGIISFPFSGLSMDTHLITLTVVDEMNAICSASITHTVGISPVVNIDSPMDGSTYNEGDEVLYSATVSDDRNAPNELELVWTQNGSPISYQSAEASGVTSFSDNTLAIGNYTVKLSAMDSEGLTGSDEVSFVVNGLPSAPTVRLSPSPAYTEDTLSVFVDIDSVDPEGDPISYSYLWSKNGTVQTNQVGQSIAFSETSKNDVWTVVVTPSDGFGNGESGEAELVVQNTAPTLNSISLSPSGTVYTDANLNCLAFFDDPDESPSVTYSWSINGTDVGNAPSLSLSSAGASPGDVVTCVASATDGDGASTSGSASTTVENLLPSVVSVILEPYFIFTNDTISATAFFSDGDATQTVTGHYAWHVIDADTGLDSEVQSGTDSTLSGILSFDKDDEVYVVVTPNDGVDDGSPFTSSSVTISNTEPTAPSVSVSPNPATPLQDDLLCSVDTASIDVDGDTISYTYVWTDPSGQTQQTTTNVAAVTDTFPASSTRQGPWTCTVTPYDGQEYGTPDADSTEVGSGLPLTDLLFWFDASQGTSCASDGCAISEWQDRSGNQYHALQSQSSRQPVFRSAALQGMDAIDFDEDYLEIPSISLFQGSNEGLSVLIVFATDNNTPQRFLLNHGPTACHCSCTFELGYAAGNGVTGNFGLHRGCGHSVVTNGNLIPNSTPVLMTTIVSSSGNSPHNIQFYKDGILASDQNHSSGWSNAGSYSVASSPLQIGMRNDYQTGHLDAEHVGLISEIVVYSTDLSQSDQRLAECYLSNKYSLGVAHCPN